MMMGGKAFGFAGGDLLPTLGYQTRTGVGVFGGGIAGLGSPGLLDPATSYYEKRNVH
jgi:hypothetical protein